MYPVCQLQRAVSHYQLVSGKTYDYLPVCDEKGEYEPQQCDITGSTCWCVDGTGRMVLNSKKQVQNRQQDIGCSKLSNICLNNDFLHTPHNSFQ